VFVAQDGDMLSYSPIFPYSLTLFRLYYSKQRHGNKCRCKRSWKRNHARPWKSINPRAAAGDIVPSATFHPNTVMTRKPSSPIPHTSASRNLFSQLATNSSDFPKAQCINQFNCFLSYQQFGRVSSRKCLVVLQPLIP